MEEVTIDVDEEYASNVIDNMNQRKAEMTDMKDTGAGKNELFLSTIERINWLSK